MLRKINLTSMTITVMCILIIASPYIAQRINNIIKLLIEIIVIAIFACKNKIEKKDVMSCIPILLYFAVSLLCTFRTFGFSSRLINAIITSGAYVIFFLVFNVYSRKVSKEKIIDVVKKNIIFYSIILDFFVIITLGKGLGGLGEAVYLIGNKFMLAYIHMFVFTLISYPTPKIKSIIFYYIYSIILLKIADTTTGLIGMTSLFVILYLCNKNKNILHQLVNPKTVILFFLITNLVFLLIPEIFTIPFIKDIFLKYSHTETVLSGRLAMYKICMEAIPKKLFLGYGLNYDIVRNTLGFGNPQNGFLKILLDFGLLGLFSFMFVIYYCFKKINNSEDNKLKTVLTAFTYSMLICSLVEINLAAIFMLGLGLANMLSQEEPLLSDNCKIYIKVGWIRMKKILKKIIYRNKYDSESYIKYLKQKGMHIGDGSVIYDPVNTLIDETRPWLINIGKNVKITYGVTILTHGFDWSVIKGKYGDVLGSSGMVTIGDNVFIGVKTTILKGTKIGNNVIIGANSLINKDIPDNVVVAGNPAKIICSLDEYYKKRIKSQTQEATELAIEYYQTYNCWPDKEILREFIFLFEERNKEKTESDLIFNEIASINNNYCETEKKFMNTNGKFNGYEDFIEHCKRRLKG